MRGTFLDFGPAIQEKVGDEVDDFEFVELIEKAVNAYHGIDEAVRDLLGADVPDATFDEAVRVAVYAHCDY